MTAHRRFLLERLADFIEAFFIEVVNALCALCTEVDQFVFLAHGIVR